MDKDGIDNNGSGDDDGCDDRYGDSSGNDGYDGSGVLMVMVVVG